MNFDSKASSMINIKPEKNNCLNLLQTEQFFSSVPSPHPSRPEQAIALDLHLPLPHLNGQYSDSRLRALPLQIWAGSSLPSLHPIIALQNSYSGKHLPSEHWKVLGGQPRFLVAWQSVSSSPPGQSLTPSQRLAFEMQRPETLQVNDSIGHLLREHSSSEPSTQSLRPSQTKNQLIHWPVLRH